MVETSRIREHMEVVSSDDHHVGRVDHVMGTEIELAKFDIPAMGKHHKIPLSWVDYVDDKVHLNLSADAAKDQWSKAN